MQPRGDAVQTGWREPVRLDRIALGFWNGFGHHGDRDGQARLLRFAVDQGVKHFDLANVYGPPHGAAESALGGFLTRELRGMRDQLTIATKAGMDMGPGAEGGGSRSHLVQSLDHSLQRIGVETVDLFYSHRPDGSVPIEETIETMVSFVREGKARAIGLSNYSAGETAEAARIAQRLGVPIFAHQTHYSMLHRAPENGSPSLLSVLSREGISGLAYSPLEQGLLSARYAEGIPPGSRASKHLPGRYAIHRDRITNEYLGTIRALKRIAEARQSSISVLALSWVLSHAEIDCVVLGVSTISQLSENLGALVDRPLEARELSEIDDLLRVRSPADSARGGAGEGRSDTVRTDIGRGG